MSIEFKCVYCGNHLRRHPTVIECITCGSRFLVEDGIPDFLAGIDKHVGVRDLVQDIDRIIKNYDAIHASDMFDATAEMHEAIELADLSDGIRVIDVGCGTGSLFGFMNHLKLDIIGLDISNTALLKAKERYPNTDLIRCIGELIPLPDNSIDVLFCMGSLEHFFSIDLGLKEFYRILKPKGYAMVLLPRKAFLLKNAIYYYLFPKFHPIAFLKRIYRRVNEFKRTHIQIRDQYFSKNEIIELFNTQAFTIDTIEKIPSDTFEFLAFDFLIKLKK